MRLTGWGVLMIGLASILTVRAQVGDLVHLSGGSFIMGTDPARVDELMSRFHTKRRELFLAELPAHRVTVPSFSIDRTEVTNAAFKRFVESHPQWSRDRLPTERHNGEYLKTWQDDMYPAGEADLPVTFVTWDAASAYCGALGRRLPTEVEWEFAAGGGHAAEFPWGDENPDPTRANFSGTGLGKPARVGSAPPVRGLHDMSGNVWEFVEDRWKDDYTDTTSASPDRRVIRGGSFGGSAVNLRVRYRDSHPQIGAGPHVGFRCARSAEVNNP